MSHDWSRDELIDRARAWLKRECELESPEPFALWYADNWPEGNKSMREAWRMFRPDTRQDNSMWGHKDA